jgi:hypothetical protein
MPRLPNDDPFASAGGPAAPDPVPRMPIDTTELVTKDGDKP